MAAYYNENDPKTAAWLRELIKARLVADGEVDERSIVDVRAEDLRVFRQCHFFAGIGGWSYALRLAGWPDERPVWTGSCPCQPFSTAGKGYGASDSRHLWPAWFRIIRECRPAIVFGEQVASADGLGWLDRVSTDLEGEDYAVGAADLCAACVGAFHIRQRLWWVADLAYAAGEGRQRGREHQADSWHAPESERLRAARELGNAGSARSGRDAGAVSRAEEQGAGEWRESLRIADEPQPTSHARELGDAGIAGLEGCWTGVRFQHSDAGCSGKKGQAAWSSGAGFWSNVEWIYCRDGKARPVEPGTFPLVTRLPEGLGRSGDPGAPFHDAEARVMRLRGYGNSIVPQVAAEFVRAYAESL